MSADEVHLIERASTMRRIFLGDQLTYRVAAAPAEVEQRLRAWDSGIDRFRVDGERFWLAPHGMWRWMSWRRWISLHGRVRPERDESVVRAWYPFDVLQRLAVLGVLVVLVIVSTRTAIMGTVGVGEAALVVLIIALNTVLFERAHTVLRETLEAAMAMPTKPSWRYRID